MLPCRDGYAALVYNEKDWTSIQKMLGDDRLEDERLDSLQKRMVHQELWLPIVRDWAASRTKAELNALFLEYAVPAAAVATPRDLLQDPLLQHRKAFHPRNKSDGTTVMAMREPHRIIHRMPATTAPQVRASIDAPGVAAGQLPLSGIRVLDLGIITAGAGTGGLIADMGAEVLKIESATYPDPFRFWAGSDDSPLFKFNNRNKYGVGLDLKTDEGKARFFELVKSADVVVENFRRGVIERMGFGLEALRQHNPRIVLASISGQGADGPGAHHATYGSTLEANSGFAALTCYEEGRPYITGYNVNYPDQTVCLYGAAAIALAVQSARDQNCSLHIDISQRDTAAFIIGDVIERVSAGMSDLPDVVRGATSPNAFEGVFKSSDGVYLAVSVTDWQQVSDSPELDGVTTREALAAWVEARSHEIAESDLLAAGCGAARCMDGKGMYELERTQATETFQHTQSGALVKGFPFQFLGNPMKVWCEAPAIGQHNDRFVDSL
jgi:crotonobetainyl-CoA:carnitine CoA-transferase CaiB-like acyl-CoA transferase